MDQGPCLGSDDVHTEDFIGAGMRQHFHQAGRMRLGLGAGTRGEWEAPRLVGKRGLRALLS